MKPNKKWAAQPAQMSVTPSFGLPGPARKLFPLVEPAQSRPWAYIFSRARPMGAHWACGRPILIQPQQVGFSVSQNGRKTTRNSPQLALCTVGNNWRVSNGFAPHWWIFRHQTAWKGCFYVCFSYFGRPSPSPLVWRLPMPAQLASQPKWAPVTCPNPAELAQAHPRPDGHRAGQFWARAFQMGFTYGCSEPWCTAGDRVGAYTLLPFCKPRAGVHACPRIRPRMNEIH